MFQPFEERLVRMVRAKFGQRVLDVGCGTGSTTLAVARRLGAQGYCMGVDISAPMLEVARARAKLEGTFASFLCADAQRHPFEPASFDLIISRFGVMFFDQPVNAFANLRSAASQGAQLRFIAWRSAAENPFMTTAERAAAPLLPRLPPRRADAPGQFSFADRQRMAAILQQSGWMDVYIQPIDVECSLPEQALVGYFTRLGPVGLVLQEADEITRSQVVATVRAAFNSYVQGAEVRYTAACWMVSATAP
ncbi:class I SAM-dependent methyltransferase [Dyella choica]|uniref:Class I SAM-dependent methyltransferase n=2 Tax=Dyella choica TaxID=1927959 RepID=A0A3S0PIQ3_9GAMM|nr:class I SAM-dependent methyltransferase [Dyella choica]